jgi:hypothetical protein
MAKAGPATIEGHAWLECEGEIVLGGGDLDRYAEMLAWHGKQR